jgi:hypothetical protein
MPHSHTHTLTHTHTHGRVTFLGSSHVVLEFVVVVGAGAVCVYVCEYVYVCVKKTLI